MTKQYLARVFIGLSLFGLTACNTGGTGANSTNSMGKESQSLLVTPVGHPVAERQKYAIEQIPASVIMVEESTDSSKDISFGDKTSAGQNIPNAYEISDKLDLIFNTNSGRSAQQIEISLRQIFPDGSNGLPLRNYLSRRFDVHRSSLIDDMNYISPKVNEAMRHPNGTVMSLKDIRRNESPKITDFRAFDVRAVSYDRLEDGNIDIDKTKTIAVILFLRDDNSLQNLEVAEYYNGYNFKSLKIPFRFDYFLTSDAATRGIKSYISRSSTLNDVDNLMQQAGAKRYAPNNRWSKETVTYNYTPRTGRGNLAALAQDSKISWSITFDFSDPANLRFNVRGPYREQQKIQRNYVF